MKYVQTVTKQVVQGLQGKCEQAIYNVHATV